MSTPAINSPKMAGSLTMRKSRPVHQTAQRKAATSSRCSMGTPAIAQSSPRRAPLLGFVLTEASLPPPAARIHRSRVSSRMHMGVHMRGRCAVCVRAMPTCITCTCLCGYVDTWIRGVRTSSPHPLGRACRAAGRLLRRRLCRRCRAASPQDISYPGEDPKRC